MGDEIPKMSIRQGNWRSCKFRGVQETSGTAKKRKGNGFVKVKNHPIPLSQCGNCQRPILYEERSFSNKRQENQTICIQIETLSPRSYHCSTVVWFQIQV